MYAEEEQRVAIKFCCKADISASKTVELIQKAYVAAAVSLTTIFEGHKCFREGRESVKDDKHSGRPTTSRTDNIAAIVKIFQGDVSVNRRHTWYPVNSGSMGFKRRLAKRKTVCQI
jgi:hypothetical protein